MHLARSKPPCCTWREKPRSFGPGSDRPCSNPRAADTLPAPGTTAAADASRTRRAPAALVAALDEEIATQERLAAVGDARGFVESDRRFHRLLVAATGNEILVALHDSLRDRQARMGLSALSADDDRGAEIVAEHRALAAAIAAGDPGAADLLTTHLERTRTLLRARR